jgi:hypothetical protein
MEREAPEPIKDSRSPNKIPSASNKKLKAPSKPQLQK